MPPTTPKELIWQPLSESNANDVVREAKRYCPEFPFEPSLVEEATNIAAIYTEDYRLVRLSADENAYRKEVWGFYAPGDFYPLDGACRAFEKLNEIAPLCLSLDSILDYTLLRLRFELPAKIANQAEPTEFRLAKIITKPTDLPPGKIRFTSEQLSKLIAEPTIEMAPEWELADDPPSIQPGRLFRVVVFAAIYHSATEWELVQVFAQIEPDGMLTIGLLDERRRFGKVALGATPEPVVLNTRRTRTAMPIKEWRVLGGNEADAVLQHLKRYGVEVAARSQEGAEPSRIKVLLRQAKLAFYKSCELLEVLIPHESTYRRSYGLIQIESDQISIYPLSGKSPVIHGINKTGTELHLTEEIAKEYLRFFCWAIHSDGPFYVPRNLREIPFLAGPSAEQRKALKGIDFNVSLSKDTEAHVTEGAESGFPFTAPVAYVSGAFQAWFVVERTGMVRMLNDKALVTDLVIYKDQYSDTSQDLFTLKEPEPKVIPELTLVRQVILGAELSSLDNAWSHLVADAQTNSTNAPEIKPSLRKLLEHLPSDWHSQNAALKFLRAQLSQSSEESITPNSFREGVKSLISDIRPDKTIKAEAFVQALADTGNASSFDIEDAVVLSTASIHARSRRDSPQHQSHTAFSISGCWFKSYLQLTIVSDVALVFERCVFERGVFAEGAEIGKALRFTNCVFIGGEIALDMENASISGPLVLVNCSLKGAFYAPRLRAHDHVHLLGCGIASNLSTISTPWSISQMMDRKWPDPEGEFEQIQSLAHPAISLVGARVEGILAIRAASDATMIYGSISSEDAFIGQALDMFGASCEKGISFSRSHMSRLVDLRFLRILEGSLNFSYAKIEGDCRMIRTQINGGVGFYQTNIGGNLSLLGLKTSDDLNLAFAKVSAFIAAYHTASDGWVPSLSVGGDLILSGAEARAIEFRGAEVTGRIQIFRGNFEELTLAVGAIPMKFDQPEIGNNSVDGIVPRPCRTSALEITGIQVQRLNVSGLVVELPKDERLAKRLRMNHRGGFLLEDSRIGQDLIFFTERIRVSLERRWNRNLDQSVHWHEVPISQDFGARIWGNLVLRTNKIEGGLDLRNLEVEGDIYLNDTTVGQDVNIDSGHPNFDTFRTKCNNFHAENLKCSGDLKLSGIRASKDLRAKNATVLGDVIFLPSETKDRLDEGDDVKLIPDSQATIDGDLDLSAVEVKGDLDLRNLKLNGDILLNDTSVRFDLNLDGVPFSDFATVCNNFRAEGLKCAGKANFSGLRTFGDLRARDLQVSSDIAFLAPEPRRFARIGGSIDLTAAKANRLTFSGDNLCTELRAEDCDISKLALDLHAAKQPFAVVLQEKISTNTRQLLKNRNGHISRELEKALVDDLNNVLRGPCLYSRQRFEGMKLSKETCQLADEEPVDNVYVNRRILQELYPTAKQKEPRVTLERAQIDHFEILNSSRFGNVNLLGVSVSNWVFPGLDDSRPESGHAQDYIDVLNGLTPFDRSMWINVEKLLRNQSQVGDANKIYREMRRKIKADTDPGPVLSFLDALVGRLNTLVPEQWARLLRRFKHWCGRQYGKWLKPTLWHVWDRLQYISIGYSTRVWIPMIPALIFFVISVFIFSQPKYVRASPSLVQVLQGNLPEGQTVNIQETPDRVGGVVWSTSDGAILALRYHVPILNSLTQSWWEASGTPLFRGFTAEHYASIVEFYHWIAWPIFLLGAAAQVFRGRQD